MKMEMMSIIKTATFRWIKYLAGIAKIRQCRHFLSSIWVLGDSEMGRHSSMTEDRSRKTRQIEGNSNLKLAELSCILMIQF